MFLLTICGKAHALPQDYPCRFFTLYETKILEQNADELHNLYKGQDGNYVIEIEAFWNLNSPDDSADCGTAGCVGSIINMKTKQEHFLSFFL